MRQQNKYVIFVVLQIYMIPDMRKLTTTIIFCFSILSGNVAIGDELYSRLDSMIMLQSRFTDEKSKEINVIKSILKDKKLTDIERYSINSKLFKEYEAFKYDSAFKYVESNIQLASKMGDQHRIMLSKLEKAHIISVAGIFDEAENVLNSIDFNLLSGEDLMNYYNQWCELYLFKAEFSNGTQYYNGYIDRAKYYRKLIIDNANKDSYLYTSTLANYVCQLQQYDKAISLLSAYLNKLNSGDRQYSIVTSTLAFFYYCKGDYEQQKKYLILSATSDLKGCIRENNSIRELSSILFAEGNVERAYKYLNVSIEDANFYGTRLRNTQASLLIPQIVSGYQTEQHAQHKRIVILLIAISIVAILLITGLTVIYWLLKRYRRANYKVKLMNIELNKVIEKLQQTNGLMQEANGIKEEYLGRFLEFSSILIDNVEQQRKTENRLAKDHKLPELYEILKSNEFINSHTKQFYQNFDSAFLNIYPNFVCEVNKLLNDDGQIIPKQDEKLTTELRILALIRLGFTDNQKISSILRSSITTIYTYRSKLKARSKYKDDFEQKVIKIDSYI